jgi:hypothetical protein
MQKTWALFAATTLIAVIVAGYLWQQLRTERERSAQLELRVAAIESRPSASNQTASAVPQSVTSAVPAQVAPLPMQGGPAAAVPMTMRTATLTANDITPDSPFCVLQRDQARAQIQRDYATAASELSLSVPEVEALKELLIKQRASAPGTPCGGGPMSREAIAAAEQAQQAELAALLGSRYQQWQQFQNTVEARQRVNALRERLSASGSPLSDAQGQALLATLTAEVERSKLEAGAPKPAPADPGAQLDQQERTLDALERSYGRILASAAGYLSPDQLKAMKTPMDQRIKVERNFVQMQRERIASGDNGPLPQLLLIGP